MASLFKRNNGIFYIAFYDFEGNRRWRSTRSRDQEEAKRIAETISSSLERPKLMTLSAFQKLVCQYVSTNLSSGTLSIYQRSFDKLIHALGDIALIGVTPLLIEKFKQKCLADVKPVTVNIYLRTIQAAFNLGVNWRLVSDNPAQRCKEIPVPDKEPTYFTKTDFKTLLDSVNDIQFRNIIIIAVHEGMRRGEICNLMWEDLDFQNSLIRIRNRGTFRVKGMHPRTIPMHPFIKKMLLTLRKTEGYVFVNKEEKALKPHYITRVFKQYVHKSGLSEHYHFHNLRDTCASWLTQAQTPIYEVQKLLGHKNLSTTEIYCHLENDGLRRSLARINVLAGLSVMN